MSAVSPILRKTIQELFTLTSLDKFALGGGTNLALQYNHRISDDIDLFSPDIIGTAGYEEIVKEVKSFYGDKVFGINYPCDLNEQFTFLRFFIIADGMNIKVEVIQNMKHLDPVEKMDDIRYFSKKDIGLFKLSCAVNRSSKKDIYDLDFITNDIPPGWRECHTRAHNLNKKTDPRSLAPARILWCGLLKPHSLVF